MRMTTTDHLLVERDLELGSRRGDTAMAAERTRSVGWVFAQAAQGSKPRPSCEAQIGNTGAIERRHSTLHHIGKLHAKIGRTDCTWRYGSPRTDWTPLRALFLCGDWRAYFPVKVAIDASNGSPIGSRVLWAGSAIAPLALLDALEHRQRGSAREDEPGNCSYQ